jgi:outer membrane receptor for ferrienterochelin and colicins
MMSSPLRKTLLAVLVQASLVSVSGFAQTPPVPATEPPAEKIDPNAPQKIEQIEVKGKNDATETRRNSTAAKIIITREDIEQYGDSNLGDVMRRLPGVTQGGRPGRPGAPRMRGMGGGFTQILIDGQRVPPGFSVEDITPEQVERIEILRAPTAETGARAIAGTINIVLREPIRQTNNEVKTSVQSERGLLTPNVSVGRNGSLSEVGTYNINASYTRPHQRTDTATHTTYVNELTGVTEQEQRTFESAESVRESVFLGSRLQWRLGPGEQFGLQGFFGHNSAESVTAGTLSQSVGVQPAPYAIRDSTFNNRFDFARLNANLNKRLDAETRYELRGSLGGYWQESHSDANQRNDLGTSVLRQLNDTEVRDRSWNAAAKVIRGFDDGKHSVTAGVEMEGATRKEDSLTLYNGVQQLADLGTQFDVSTQRLALYAQDEWELDPQWAVNIGARYETIETRSDAGEFSVRNTSRVFSPLGHVVWRFAEKSRDQLRLSLTQSYRSPNTGQLLARPSLNTLYPVPGENTAITPDRAGNPSLKPEQAHGIDLAYESYFKSGGVVSVNVFARQIKDLIRNVTALETISWAPVPRYVSRPQNIGDALVRGIEFDAKFQLKELIETTIPLSLRLNASVYDSDVKGVIGPNNRIDEQPRGVANLGGDYKFSGLPLALSANLSWTPAYETQRTNEQIVAVNTKRVWDTTATWSFSPTNKLRLVLSNIGPLDSISTTTTRDAGQIQTVESVGRTDLSVALRWEMRL